MERKDIVEIPYISIWFDGCAIDGAVHRWTKATLEGKKMCCHAAIVI